MRASDLIKTWGFFRIKSSNSYSVTSSADMGEFSSRQSNILGSVQGTAGKLLSTGDGTRL